MAVLEDAYSMFFCHEERTMGSFRGVMEVVKSKALFCSLHTDRDSHCWRTPKARGKVDKGSPTRFGRALARLGVEMIRARPPVARGRPERVVGRNNRLRFGRLALQPRPRPLADAAWGGRA